MKNKIIVLLFMLTFSISVSMAQSDMHHNKSSDDHIMMTADDLNWVEGPASLPTGTKVAILEGNPTKEGPFTVRLELPADYSIKPHWHPGVEHISVISGEFFMGLGESFDESKAKGLPAEGFAVMQVGTKHFAFTKDQGAVIQLHGIGPWEINYVNPTDDPRKHQTQK
jgi:hypothetical protein